MSFANNYVHYFSFYCGFYPLIAFLLFCSFYLYAVFVCCTFLCCIFVRNNNNNSTD